MPPTPVLFFHTPSGVFFQWRSSPDATQDPTPPPHGGTPPGRGWATQSVLEAAPLRRYTSCRNHLKINNFFRFSTISSRRLSGRGGCRGSGVRARRASPHYQFLGHRAHGGGDAEQVGGGGPGGDVEGGLSTCASSNAGFGCTLT